MICCLTGTEYRLCTRKERECTDTDHKGQRAQGHSRTIQIRKTSVTRYDTMMSHFVRGRYNAIDWLEFRNLLISYLR